MIFQNSNKKSAQDDPAVAMPAAQPVAEESANQDDQELARVLADIDNQVNTNNDNLMADLENATALENSQPAEPAETAEATEATDATEPMADLAPAFERIDQETDVETSPLTDSQPIASPEVNIDSQPAEPSLDQQLATMNQQISNNMAELASNQDQSAVAEVTDSVEITDAAADLPIETTASDTSSEPLSAPALVSDLDELRKKALSDLRPIVDKVELNDEESFYILLLLIRETDDESLLPKAYEAARQIRDEARRAQALLDVIKEADYFKHKA